MNMTRRDMLKVTAAGAAVAGFPIKGFSAENNGLKISLQLYSVRNHCKENFDKALADVAGLGFEGVEFAGYYQYENNAKELKKKLDDLGLKAAGTHVRADNFDDAKINKTIEFHKEIGCKYLVVPGDQRFSDPEKSKEYAELINKTAETFKPHGLYCGHHNHTSEFKIAEGDKTYWDLFAERTNKDVVLQQDVGWTVHAGLDPVKFIKKYPDRTKITHFKPTAMSPELKPIIGQDSVPWKEIIAACREVGGTEWITIEQEKYPDGKTPMECSGLSLEGLKKLL